MKTPIRIALLLLVATPVALFATANDRKIEAAARASYNYRTVLHGNVNIEARDGVVTLSGTVADQDEKTLATDTVENLPGVVRVKNDINVMSMLVEHSDAWIGVKIRSRLLVKGHVSAATTGVAVKDGVVTLSGTAESQAQKELTEAYAKDIDHVKSVKNELVVTATVAGGHVAGEAVDDASITTQVKYALLTHRSTSAVKTKIVTTDGVVAVSGEALNAAEKALVTKLTEGVRGVRSVNNQMTVKA